MVVVTKFYMSWPGLGNYKGGKCIVMLFIDMRDSLGSNQPNKFLVILDAKMEGGAFFRMTTTISATNSSKAEEKVWWFG